MRVEDLIAKNLALSSENILANITPLITPVYNVVGYGAKGDGVTDDTVAIQAAITAAEAAGGGIVYFPSGKVFLCNSPLHISGSYITFIGYGAVLYANFTTVGLVQIESTANDINILGCDFDSNPSFSRSSTSAFIGNAGTRVRILKNTFKNCSNINIWNGSAKNVLIANNIIIGKGAGTGAGGDGIHITGASQYIDVIGNIFYNVDDDCVGIIQYSSDPAPPKHINVVGNLMYNGGSRGVAISGAQDVLVAGNYINTTHNPGVEIHYYQVANSAENITISGNYFINCGTSNTVSLLIDRNINVIIKDNAFQSCPGIGILIVNFSNLKIQNNVFNNVGSRGIMLNENTLIASTGLMIVGNMFDTCALEGINLSPISGQTMTSVIVANNILSNTNTSNATPYSITVTRANGLTLINNVASWPAYSTGTVYYDTGTCTDVYAANNHP